MTVAFQIRGMDKLLAQLKELEAELAVKALATAARKAFKPVLDAAKAMVPRHSGALADAIKLRVERPSAGDTVVRVGLMIGSSRLAKQAQVAAAAFGEAQSTELPPARRWHFVELGTAHQAAHPYLRPALDHNASAVLDILRVELDAAIKKVAR